MMILYFLCVYLPMFLCMKWDYLRHGIKESWTQKPDHHTNNYIYIYNISYFDSKFMIVKHIDFIVFMNISVSLGYPFNAC